MNEHMNVVGREAWTIASFLAWEAQQERPWEFDGPQPVAMNGGSIGHEAISFNIRKALESRLAGGRCRPFGPLVKIVAGASVRYPDAVVSCTPQRSRSQIVEAPVVVFEVLSPGTSRIDRNDKMRDYGAVSTIGRYVILEQDSMVATAFARIDDAWSATSLTAADMLFLPEIGISIPLTEFYVGFDLSVSDDIAQQGTTVT